MFKGIFWFFSAQMLRGVSIHHRVQTIDPWLTASTLGRINLLQTSGQRVSPVDWIGTLGQYWPVQFTGRFPEMLSCRALSLPLSTSLFPFDGKLVPPGRKWKCHMGGRQ